MGSVKSAAAMYWLGGQPGAGRLGSTTIRCNLSSLFDALGEANAIAGNVVEGMKRPEAASLEDGTSAIGDHQACGAGGTG
ncbi:hypothetical protein LK540_22250 [Massilia sp. IC2-278]|uniref:hypothetical protein n=1 Tax=Massilia sp. IC2-278 TaxID=2887200 RepID=UPI001E5A9ADD|nr:hypothetical protein [Massilia sp. IC2-278]MCC2963161.1 hypothetical protein [Massilia sp. IC2-278]